MNVYLAGDPPFKKINEKEEGCEIYKDANILQSFAYTDKFSEKYIIPNCKNFILDSGAFTFRMNKEKAPNFSWDRYVEQYAAFINRNKIDLFFELDIDSLVGYEEVKKLRHKLEMRTNKRCIPVWHFERGKNEFLSLCQEYDYVALGGIAGRNAVKINESYFPWFIKEAHKKGSKIHALGYTSMKGIAKYKFDSVDSTSWLAGSRYGTVYKFTGDSIQQIKRPPGTRVATYETAIRNFIEWKKFSNWAEVNL